MGKHELPTDPAPSESEAAATVKQEAEHPGWRATLYTMWVAQMLAMVGFAFVMPFIPFYIRQLWVTNARMVPIWAGLAVTGVTSAVASIVVGRCSDRWGHKPMLVACVGLAGVMCLPQAIVHSVTQLLVVRAIFGMAPAMNAMMASMAPRHRLGQAYGMTTAASSIGWATGSALGGWAASVFGLRAPFVMTGVVLIAMAAIAQGHLHVRNDRA
jgi:DHA1 family multidrug resistance protein-like MFS transporter